MTKNWLRSTIWLKIFEQNNKTISQRMSKNIWEKIVLLYKHNKVGKSKVEINLLIETKKIAKRLTLNRPIKTNILKN